MNKSQYDSVIDYMESSIAVMAKHKGPTPQGALNRPMFNNLPEGTNIWLVWSLGPASYISDGRTRKLRTYDIDPKNYNSFDPIACFPYSKRINDKESEKEYNRYANEHYRSYNLTEDGYNDSYIFTDEKLARDHLAYCRAQPRFKTQEEKELHEQTLREMDAISESMTYDFINDPRYDD